MQQLGAQIRRASKYSQFGYPNSLASCAALAAWGVMVQIRSGWTNVLDRSPDLSPAKTIALF